MTLMSCSWTSHSRRLTRRPARSAGRAPSHLGRIGKTIVFITHGIDEAVYLGQRVAVMTSRPGRIKQVIDIPLVSRSREEDLRAALEFSRLRHEVWSLLRDEFRQAEILERDRVSGAGAPPELCKTGETS
jgi:ABC-type uncharacterized transport system ATPase subunit